jgi:hypothetical protein
MTVRTSLKALLAPAALAGVVLLPALSARAQDPPPAPTPPTPPPAPEPQRRPRFYIGPELGVYFPTDSKTKDAFGSTIFNYGIGLGAVGRASDKGAFGVDFRIITGRGSNGRMFLAPLGIQYARALGDPTSQTNIPYVGASANLFLTHLDSDKYGVNGKLRFAGGGSVFLGVTFSERGYIQARYYGVSKVAGFNLSGFGISTGYRF